ncbi:MAG: ABC transporter permease [Microbacteriaceae bacterium]|nr:ABC transporter permease [Microbacteriaceae bacterium]
MRSHPGRTRWGTRLTVALVAVLPLAFAGLFVASLGDANDGIRRIPAAVVNADTLIQQKAADGTTTPIFAGRQLVTELTGSSNPAFDWKVTNAEKAKSELAAGTVYAILTVPKDFSKSLLTLSTDAPRQARLSIRTDDAHSYLTAPLAQTVGASMVSAFGQQITANYLGGVSASIGTLGSSLATAADGASKLADGASALGAGLGGLGSGASSAQEGAAGLTSGIAKYTGGVSALSVGLGQLKAGAGGLSGISSGVTQFTGGVSQLSAAIAAASVELSSPDPVKARVAAATVQALSARLASAAAGGASLATQTAGGIAGVQSGIARSASGAATLSAGSGALSTGAQSLRDGLGRLAAGATTAATGADSLTSGATALAGGLRDGAARVPGSTPEQQKQAASVIANPVGFSVVRNHEVNNLAQTVATFMVPLGLWLGALAIFLIARPLARGALASTARSGRLLASGLGRAAAVALAQALLLVLLLRLTAGVTWLLLPVTLAFSLLIAVAFTSFHYLLTLAFGRGGLVISLALLAVQLTATGGLFPVQLLAKPFEAISGVLPLSYAVTGMQSIIAGGNPATVITAALALIGFGVASLLLGVVALRRTRRAQGMRLFAEPVAALS